MRSKYVSGHLCGLSGVCWGTVQPPSAGKGLLGDGLLKTGSRCTFSGFVLKRHHCLNKAVACAQSQIR